MVKPHDSCLESLLERSAHHSSPSDARAMIVQGRSKQCCLCETGGASGVDDEIMDRVSDIRRQRQEQQARKQRRDEQSQRIARRLALAHAWFSLSSVSFGAKLMLESLATEEVAAVVAGVAVLRPTTTT